MADEIWFEPAPASNPINGLFLLSGGGPKAYLYYVQPESQATTDSIAFIDTWKGPPDAVAPDVPGWYVFVKEQVTEADALDFATHVRTKVADVSRLGNGYTQRCIAWVADVAKWLRTSDAPPSLILQQYSWSNFNLSSRVIAEKSTFEWSSSLHLELDAGATVEFTASELARFEFTASGELEIGNAKRRGITGAYPPSSGWVFAIPLASKQSGSFAIPIAWDPATLRDEFGCDFRYFIKGDGDAPQHLQFPLFPPESGSPSPNRTWGFDMWLHPLYPEDSNCTRLVLDLSGRDDGAVKEKKTPSQRSQELVSQYFRTTHGNAVRLKPKRSNNAVISELGPRLTFDATDPGFALVKSPLPGAKANLRDWQYGMAPVGRFAVEGGEAKGSASTQLMCGIAGTEFLLLTTGDELEFVPGKPCFAPNFPDGPGLKNDFTTSWVRMHQNGTEDQVLSANYCAQPSSATYFARHVKQSAEDFSVAIGVSLSQPAQLVPDKNPCFPLLPFGGVFGAGGIPNVNEDLAAETVGAFETQVVEPKRRDCLEPTFNESQSHGPIFFDTADNQAFQGGCARTPMGFIANLNKSGIVPAGSWKTLQLAQSPQIAGQFLELTPDHNGVVNPTFSSASMRDNLFMVVTDPNLLWPNSATGNEIKLGDFTFQVNIGSFNEGTDKNKPKALAVFKTVPGVKFVDLVNDTKRWTSFFTGLDDDQAATEVQTQIKGYLADAKNGDQKLYAAFNAIVRDPNWTGVLFFNCPLDYKDLPSDIQILLGGIDGTLRAHHFGITINRVKNDDTTGAMSMENSSLFAVIDYKKNFVKPQVNNGPPHGYPNFQVLLFNVSYANSKLVIFNSRIAFSISELFGNPVELTTYPKGDTAKGEEGDDEKLYPVKPVPVAKVTCKGTGTIVIDGVYTLRADNTGSLVFSTHDFRVFTPKGSTKPRVLEAQSIDNATLVPVRKAPPNGGAALASFRLDSTLAFEKDIAGDLFSYGATEGTPKVPKDGLVIIDYAFAMTTMIPATEGPAKLTENKHDLSGLKVDQGQSKSRKNSFDQTFPSKIDSLIYVAGGKKTSQTGAWQVKAGKGVADAVQHKIHLEDVAPDFMLHFKIPMGSLGGLVSSTNNIISDLYIGWIAGGNESIADRAGAVLVLPGLIAGPDGFNIQGIASSKFQSVFLDRPDIPIGVSATKSVYDLRFQHYSSSLLGMPLIRNNNPKDLGIFGAPNDPGGDNSMWFVGRTADPQWNGGPAPSMLMSIELPIFIGRSFKIDTDPTDPKVIDKAITKLTTLQEKTVTEYMKKLYLDSSKYSSAAGMTFALKFDFTAVALSVLLHDNDFYGAKLKLKFGDEQKDDGKNVSVGLDNSVVPRPSGGSSEKPAEQRDYYKELGVEKDATKKEIRKAYHRIALEYHPDKNTSPDAHEKMAALNHAYHTLNDTDKRAQYDSPGGKEEKHPVKAIEDEKKEKKGLNKLQGFEFSIIYRKISEHLGVWSATIFIDVGEIEIGEGSLTLPDFSISIWTNGDWRFAVGWPLSDHPITVQFQAGPVPVIGKLGFYLAKLSSEAAPSTFVVEDGHPLPYPPNFKLIWSFGLGISAGVGKEWKKGPFSASASISLELTVQGFLASFKGDFSKDGVDYHYWCISVALIGEVSGKVDFEIISASLSITLTLKVSLAFETYHETVVKITFEAKVKASVKIVFVTIHFSFSTTLTLMTETFGSGPPAKMKGPTPKAVKDKLIPKKIATADLLHRRAYEPVPVARSTRSLEPRMAVAAEESLMYEPVPRSVMESVAAMGSVGAMRDGRVPIEVSFLLQSTAIADGDSWKPQGVASLVINSDGVDSPFGNLAKGLANWLIDNYADYGDDFSKQLSQVEAALARGEFDDEVETCLSEQQFVFKIGPARKPTDPNNPPPAAVFPVHPKLGLVDASAKFGMPNVPANYGDIVKSYFDQGAEVTPTTLAPDISVASLVFDEYFRMFAKQLITDLQGNSPSQLVDLGGATGGAFTLELTSDSDSSPPPRTTDTTISIRFDATAQAVQSALEGLKNVSSGDVKVTSSSPGEWLVVFTGLLAAKHPSLKIDSSLLTGGSPRVKSGLDVALTSEVLSNVAGFVSRFLLSGIRLPNPDDPNPNNPSPLAPLYVLTHQQFSVHRVLEAKLTGGTPGLVELDGGEVIGKLKPEQVYSGKVPTIPPWNVTATPPLSPVPVRFPMNSSIDWDDKTIFNFPDGLHLAIEDWQREQKRTDGPYLQLEKVTAGQSQNSTPPLYSATGALVLPLKIKTIPKPGAAAGKVLENTYSLVGTDEVHRASLQALLDDASITIKSVDLAVSTGQGKYKSTATPKVLVRTNLSTSTAPSGGKSGGGANRASGDQTTDQDPSHNCANYAKLGESGQKKEMAKFLRLVWECSVVHTGGFYLQVEDLNQDLFKEGPASLQLIVQTKQKSGGPPPKSIQAEAFHNALIGEPPADYAVMANLTSDAAINTPVVKYTASYPGGNAAWSIKWKSPPVEVDAVKDAAQALQGLYQMVSYQVTSPKTTNWSRPVTALHEKDDTALHEKDESWNYHSSFPTKPLYGNGNIYAGVNKTVDVSISIEDIFGNSLPAISKKLTVVYNDDILGLADWAGTQSDFKVTADAGKTLLVVNFSYGSLLFSLGDFTSLTKLATKLQDPGDAASKYVWGKFSAEAKKVLSNPQSKPAELQVALISGLNTLIRSGKIYDETTFKGVKLRKQTQALLKKGQSGNLLIFLNRLLLEDAFPTLIQAEIGDITQQDLEAAPGGTSPDKDTPLKRKLRDYVKISNQLNDPNLHATINTGKLLAPDGTLTGDPVLSLLRSYVDSVVKWLTWLVDAKQGIHADVPEPITLSFELDKSYPKNWDGDLRELRVDLLLRRDGVDGVVMIDNIKKKVSELAPQVQQVTSPITPIQGKSTAKDPTGLSAFALGFEKAYYEFDGKADGVIKVATGVNSDLKSRRFGSQSLWLARWGETAGITVDIVNPHTQTPAYYAPPPLSTQLITREVEDLMDYSKSLVGEKVEKKIFSSVDIDRVAASFLSSVESIFSPELAPPIADISGPSGSHPNDNDFYDTYVANKRKLATAIADKLAFIYQKVTQSDRTSAVKTMQQALLYTLENDYGISTLVQMAAIVGVHGAIEPNAKSSPQLYGNITPTGSHLDVSTGNDNKSKPLPYDFSSAKLPLPLKASEKGEKVTAWLNFLLSVQDPAAQSALQLELDYQMGFIEHNIDSDATRCNYTPSNWLSFVLQQNEKNLPQGKDNTLTAPMGAPRTPIPLRSYPPLPKLLSATATQDTTATEITKIEEALTWTYKLDVSRPAAAQDTLNLMVTFNEPKEKAAVAPSAARAPAVLVAKRGGDLFDALARYSFEYPHLEPVIKRLAQNVGDKTAKEAVREFRDLVTDVAVKWPEWKPPVPKAMPKATVNDEGHEVWKFTIERNPTAGAELGSIQCIRSWSRENATDMPPWPAIEGFNPPPDERTNKKLVYTLITAEKAPTEYKLSWKKFYVLDYQSALASAYIERNRNLGGNTGEKTNEAFVYRTETVRMPTSAVPLIKVAHTLKFEPGKNLEATVNSMLVTMHTKPDGSRGSDGSKSDLKLEGPISYSFRLLDNMNSDVRSFLPLFLMQNDIPPGQDEAAGKQVAQNMNDWRQKTKPKIDQSAISFRLTIFATKIVRGTEQLPLVQFQDLSVSVPEKAHKWWSTAT